MEKITSRKNAQIRHFRLLASDGAYRRERGEYLCDGVKTLQEALRFGARVTGVLYKEEAAELPGLEGVPAWRAPAELFDYASPMVNSPGPLFTVAIPDSSWPDALRSAIVMENVQDPGNVGTVIRTANAFGIGAVILAGACADPWHPKTVRASMGALFRERVIQTETAGLAGRLSALGLKLYGAALQENAADLRQLSLDRAAVAVGSEGRGLSRELLAQCEKTLIIPMNPDSESLNAAVAASVIMWEMAR